MLYSCPHLCNTQSTLICSEHLQWSHSIWGNFNFCRPQRKLKHFYLSFEDFLIGFWVWQPTDGIADLEEKSVSGSLYGTGKKWIPESKNWRLMVSRCLRLVTFKFHVWIVSLSLTLCRHMPLHVPRRTLNWLICAVQPEWYSEITVKFTSNWL